MKQLFSFLVIVLFFASGAHSGRPKIEVKGKTPVPVGDNVPDITIEMRNMTEKSIHDLTIEIEDGCGVDIRKVTVKGFANVKLGDWDVDDHPGTPNPDPPPPNEGELGSNDDYDEYDDVDATPGRTTRVDKKGDGWLDPGEEQKESPPQKTEGKKIEDGNEFEVYVEFTGVTLAGGTLWITPTDDNNLQIQCALPDGIQYGANMYWLSSNHPIFLPGMSSAVPNNTGSPVAGLIFQTTEDYRLLEVYHTDPATDSVLTQCDCDSAFSCTLMFTSPILPTDILSFGASFDQISADDSTLLVVTPILTTPPTTVIEKTHGTLQGYYEFVSITTQDLVFEFGGFEFLIAYDASVLTFMEATPGQLLEDCGWEYFAYRYGSQGICDGPCPSGLLRIIAMAEVNEAPDHPSCFGPPDTDPHELAEIKFYITNDRTFDCTFVPIRFFWHYCDDNSVSSVMGDDLYISDHVYDFDGNEVTGDGHFGGPSWLGDCEDPDTTKPSRIPLINFIHGGIDIVCADSFDLRGDINLNYVANEIADVVLFTNYFIYGLDVFVINPQDQIAATEVNNDGRVLTVGDLVYMVRIITGDAFPFPKLLPFAQSASVSMLVNHSAVAISTNSEADIGAGYFQFDHSGYEVGEPQLINGASNMTLKYHNENGVLRVLVYSREKDIKISAGTENIFAIPISGDGAINLIKTELSDYNGNLLTVTKEDKPILPKTFALQQNYPNPFNATTRITYEVPKTAHVKIDIFNIMGQKVVTLINREESVGVHAIEWNGLDQSSNSVASGVYLYRLTSDSFKSEKKMALLK